MTDAKTEFVYVTYIHSTPERVFNAITEPEVARQYWAHDNVSDWTPGSTWEHIRADAARDVKLTGTVVECTPPERLVITWVSPSNFDDISKHSRVTFEITPFEQMVRLTVIHDELTEGGGMAGAITKNWPLVLSSLKSFLETGRPIDVFALA